MFIGFWPVIRLRVRTRTVRHGSSSLSFSLDRPKDFRQSFNDVPVDRNFISFYLYLTWMTRALLGNGPVNTRDTRSQQWNNEVTQTASRQRLSKQTSAQAQ
jgi:hypothetical protein